LAEGSWSQTAGWRDRSTKARVEAVRSRSLDRATLFVRAALRLIDRTQSSDFALRELFDEAGLSRRAFYELFEGKDDLLVAAYEETIRRLVAQIERSLAQESDPVARIHAIVDHLFVGSASGSRVRRAARMTREYMRLAMERPDAMRSAIEPAIAFLCHELEAAMRAGFVRQTDPAVLAVILFNVGVSHTQTRLLETSAGADVRVTAGAHWDFCRNALGIVS